jgi:hypothetical protein
VVWAADVYRSMSSGSGHQLQVSGPVRAPCHFIPGEEPPKVPIGQDVV